uniref:Uncharacterized protein n=1 Tax=Myotis myotis TaxID=51298 RepID=A0A7J7ZXH2_MYOMY|nr:hypothetical protein mMyoMyo1_009679 [Myotis myotis]
MGCDHLVGLGLPLWAINCRAPRWIATQREFPPTRHSTASRMAWASLCGHQLGGPANLARTPQSIAAQKVAWASLFGVIMEPPIDHPAEGVLGLPLWGNCGAMAAQPGASVCHSMVIWKVFWTVFQTVVLLFSCSVNLHIMLSVL